MKLKIYKLASRLYHNEEEIPRISSWGIPSMSEQPVDTTVEVIKNPTQKEIINMLKAQKFGEVGTLLTLSNVYIFNRNLEFHRNVAMTLGLSSYVAALYDPRNGGFVMITDGTSQDMKDNKAAIDLVKTKLNPELIRTFDEDIVGDWSNLSEKEKEIEKSAKPSLDYAFRLDDFSSVAHAFLIPGVQQRYAFAWQAYKAAREVGLYRACRIAAIKQAATEDLTQPDVMDASADELLGSHFEHLYKIMSERAEGVQEDASEQEQETVYEEALKVVEDLVQLKTKAEAEKDKETKNKVTEQVDKMIGKFRTLVKKYFPVLFARDVAEAAKAAKDAEQQQQAAATQAQNAATPPVPIPNMGQQQQPQPQAQPPMPTASIQADMIKLATLENYAGAACEALQYKHPMVIYRILHNGVLLVDADTRKALIRIGVNEKLNVNQIVSVGELSEVFPSSSPEFYQRYWKPIVEKIGHYSVDAAQSMIITAKDALPDIPKHTGNFSVPCFDKNWNKATVDLWFKGIKTAWDFSNKLKKVAQVSKPNTEYTEDDFIHGDPKMVKCIDANLKTIFGKVGEVVALVPLDNHLELDIDFGNDIIRLTQKQIQIVD